MVLLCPETQEMLLNILHAINLFRSEPSHQFVRIQAKSVLQTVASVIGSWTRRQGKMHLFVFDAIRLSSSLEAMDSDHEEDDEEASVAAGMPVLEDPGEEHLLSCRG